MKTNCIAITSSDQPPQAMNILRKRAEEKKVMMQLIDQHVDISREIPF